MTKDEALKLALEALEFMSHVDSIFANEFDFQINAIKEALAQPEITTGNILMDSYNAMQSMKVEGPRHVVCQCDKCKAQPEQKPMHPQLKAMLEEYFDKCFSESAPQRTWVGLTEDDKVLIKHDANFNQFMTAGEYADRVQQLTEARLKDLNT